MGSEMDTFEARLASFDTILKPEKRRSSGVKGPRFIAWPHSSPSPAELARAGFFYKPYESNPDNTTCFECGRALDGWEEEDNPITEHLKHSPDCGWAITMDVYQNSSNPSLIEDPNSDRVAQARSATFGSAWPHDDKRGWICSSEKMVAGGWYFCPTLESDDQASCAYCKLSLDGWEPKDDPFEEHYRRAPECSFFVYAQPPTKKGKGSKSKKPRVSKASSRLSTQSVDSVASEMPNMDMDESMDQSIMSQPAAKSKSTKKTTKGKTKATKSKKEAAKAESEPEVDNMDSEQVEQPEPSKPKRAGRGKKRVSEETRQDEPEVTAPEVPRQSSVEPPSKRRNTRTRSSSISRNYNYDSNDYEMPDAQPENEEPQEAPPKRGRKPKKETKSRKASDVSVVAKSTSKARLPRDSELDAAIEAGLEEDVPEPVEPEPMEEPEPEPEQPPRASKKTKSSKKAKAAAKSVEEPIDEPEASSSKDQDLSKLDAEPEVDSVELVQEPAEEPAPKAKATKGSKKKGTKKSKKEDTKAQAASSRESSHSKQAPEDQDAEDPHQSFVSVEITNREPVPEPELEPEPQLEPEAETPEKPVTKKSSKKEEKGKKPKKNKKKEPSPSPEPVIEEPVMDEPMPVEEPIEEAIEPAVDDEPISVDEPIEDTVMQDPIEEHDQPMSPSVDEDYETPDDLPDQIEVSAPPQSSPEPSPEPKQRTPVPPKTVKRFSDIPQEEHLAESISKSHSSRGSGSRRISRVSNRPVSPLPSAHQGTPSMSPQSSDAENRPPSSRPSASRPAPQSALKEPQARTPLAAATPSPSKRNFNGGFAPSAHPWTPVDIDEVLFGEASDKENDDLTGILNAAKRGLTSPEKKMTVQEWIMWNAKNGEERLKRECERLVGQFEKEGGRAMQRLESIECID